MAHCVDYDSARDALCCGRLGEVGVTGGEALDSRFGVTRARITAATHCRADWGDTASVALVSGLQVLAPRQAELGVRWQKVAALADLAKPAQVTLGGGAAAHEDAPAAHERVQLPGIADLVIAGNNKDAHVRAPPIV